MFPPVSSCFSPWYVSGFVFFLIWTLLLVGTFYFGILHFVVFWIIKLAICSLSCLPPVCFCIWLHNILLQNQTTTHLNSMLGKDWSRRGEEYRKINKISKEGRIQGQTEEEREVEVRIKIKFSKIIVLFWSCNSSRVSPSALPPLGLEKKT